MALCAADLDASFVTTDVPPRVVTGAPMRETADSSFELLLESRSGVRAILPLGLWAVLTASAIGVANAQRVSDEVRAETRNRLDDPFQFGGVFDKDLRYARRFELVINVTPQNTIGIRV